MIDNYDFALFVLVIVELRDEFVSFDVGSWVVQCFPYMILFIVFRFSEVDQEEIGLETDWQLFSLDGD